MLKRVAFLSLLIFLAGCQILQRNEQRFPLSVTIKVSSPGYVTIDSYYPDGSKVMEGKVVVKTGDDLKVVGKSMDAKGTVRFYYPVDNARLTIQAVDKNGLRGRRAVTIKQNLSALY